MISDSIYQPEICSDIIVHSSKTGDCEGCFVIDYRFKCIITDDGVNITYIKVVTANYIKGELTELSNPTVRRSCITDADCVLQPPLRNINYKCIEQMCYDRSFDDPMAMKCINEGNHIILKKLSNNALISLCIFKNGNQCEISSHFFGGCDANTDNLTSCQQFRDGLCRKGYQPVCGKVTIKTDEGDIYSWKDFDNACLACKNMGKTEITEAYIPGICIKKTTTTIPSSFSIDPEIQYCEDKGYAFRIREYATGKEYGVCIFGHEYQCPELDYFKGLCGPSV